MAPRDRPSPTTHVRRWTFIILSRIPLTFASSAIYPRSVRSPAHFYIPTPASLFSAYFLKMGFLSRVSPTNSPFLGQAARIPSLRGSALFSVLSPSIAESPNYIPLLLVVNCAGHYLFFICMCYSKCKYLVYPDFPSPFLEGENTRFTFL